MWAKLHTEDIGTVTSSNGSGELERSGFGGRLIGVNIDVRVVAATGKKSPALGPAQCVYTTIVAIQLIHNIQLPDPISIAIETFDRGVSRAIAKLAPQETIVYGVLHLKVLLRVGLPALGSLVSERRSVDEIRSALSSRCVSIACTSHVSKPGVALQLSSVILMIQSLWIPAVAPSQLN